MKWSDQAASVSLVDDIDVEAAKRRRLVKAKLSSSDVKAVGDSSSSGDTTSDEKAPSIVDFHQMAKRMGRNVQDKNPQSQAPKSKTVKGMKGRVIDAYRMGAIHEHSEVRGQKLDKVG